MLTTTTIHWNKGVVVEDHILRLEELCSREDHIDLYNEFGKSSYEIIYHKELPHVYEDECGDALADYNQKQKRKDRKMTMDEYMKSVEDDNRGKSQTKRINGKRVVDEDASRQGKQLSYEITVKTGNTVRAKGDDGRTLYDDNNHHIRPEELPRPLQKKILFRYAGSFQEENPNFRVVNIVYHADEGFYNRRNVWEYSEDHLHIEIVPFAHGFKRGLSVQNSMNKAMKEMGFDTPDCYELWAKKEQQRLDQITKEEYEKYCKDHPDFAKEHGELTIYHPVSDRCRAGDKSKEEYARSQELEEDIAEAEYQRDRYRRGVRKVHEKTQELDELEKGLSEREDAADSKYKAALTAYQLYDYEMDNLEKYKQMLIRIKKEADKKIVEFDSRESDRELVEFLKISMPQRRDDIETLFNKYKVHKKKQLIIPDISEPTRPSDDDPLGIQKTAAQYKAVNNDYDKMQEEKDELTKEQKQLRLIRRTKDPRDLPPVHISTQEAAGVSIPSERHRKKNTHNS